MPFLLRNSRMAARPPACRMASRPTDLDRQLSMPKFLVGWQGAGFADPRGRLWEQFYRLISESKPPIIFGEQVEAAIGHGWLDRVSDDLEGSDYACGAAVLPAASVGTPHIRSRIFWTAIASGWRIDNSIVRLAITEDTDRRGGGSGVEGLARVRRGGLADSQSDGAERISDANCAERGPTVGPRLPVGDGIGNRREKEIGASELCGQPDGLDVTEQQRLEGQPWNGDDGNQPRRIGADTLGPTATPSWSDNLIVYCRDGRYRRIPFVEPLVQRLVDGLPPNVADLRVDGGFPLCRSFKGRATLLKGIGNSIVPQLAAQFIRAVADALTEVSDGK